MPLKPNETRREFMWEETNESDRYFGRVTHLRSVRSVP